MALSNPPGEDIEQPATTGGGLEERNGGRGVILSFCAVMLLVAVFQFSENTADPDLWGHITFGQEMLRTHSIPKTESYSWTALGQPWVNHERLAEISLGLSHNWLGGSGVLLLKMGVGLLTFLITLR